MREAERVQLLYWVTKYYNGARKKLADSGTRDVTYARVNKLDQGVFGYYYHVSLPEEVISPPRQPVVKRVEPYVIELPEHESEKVAIALEGENLDTVDVGKIRMLGAGTLIEAGPDAPRQVVRWRNFAKRLVRPIG